MVMARRPGVRHASWPIAATDLCGLAGQMAVAMLRVPFRRPWDGDGDLPHNLTVALTRETLRTFMGYSSSLPIAEFRSVEMVLDDLCGVVLPPVVRSLEVTQEQSTVAGVPGTWYRPRSGGSGGTMLYLHGGGYIGTSPKMYSVFAAWLARRTGCEVFVADLRLAPEFPFPAGLEDAVLVLEALLTARGRPGPSGRCRRLERGRPRHVARLLDGPHRTPTDRRGGAVLPGGEPAARPALGLRQRRSGHPALEHPDLALPPRHGPGRARRSPRSTRT